MQSPLGSPRRRWAALAAAAAATAAAAVYIAAPWDGGEEPAGAPAADTGAAADPIGFSAEPLWTTPGEGWEGNPDGVAVGLTDITDVRLSGDYLVLAGLDEDGRLSGLGYTEGGLVVVDALTGETVWSVYNRMPVPGDEEKELSGFGSTWDIEIVGDGDEAAIAVAYNGYDADTYTELGVVGLALDDGAPLWSVPAGAPSDGRNLHIVGADDGGLLINLFKNGEEPSAKTALLDIATDQTLWTQPDHIGTGISGDTAVLVETGTVGVSLTTEHVVSGVDLATGDQVWRSGDAELLSTYVGQVDGIVVVNHHDATMLDIATGERIDRMDSAWFEWCVSDEETLIACDIGNGGIAASPLADGDVRMTAVPETDDLDAVAAAAGWIFTDEEVVPRGNYLAVDPAGNTMTTRGQLADAEGDLAVFYTGDIYHDEAWGTEAAAIAVHTLER